MVNSRSETKPDTKKVESADAIKPGLASLKLSFSELQVRAGKAADWVQESNVMIAGTKKVESADAIKPGLASLKLSSSEFQVRAGRAADWCRSPIS